MKILIFTEGTIIMHQGAISHSRKKIVQQIKDKEESVKNYTNYVPVGQAVEKIKKWAKQGDEIIYLTSRIKQDEVSTIQNVLDKYKFPQGELLFRKSGEEYKDVAERVRPDILIEDDCESIGGEKEMTITHISPEIKQNIKSIPVKEFGGIDHLPDKLTVKSYDKSTR